MVSTLTFSSVDNPEIPVLVHILGLSSSTISLNEVVGRVSLGLGGEQDPRKIVLALGSLSPGLCSPKGTTESALFEQWLSLALDGVMAELKNSHDFDGSVLGPLHYGLDRKAFLTGSSEPSLVDWLLFSMLFCRISGLTASKAKQYYRAVRWAAHLSNLLERSMTEAARKALILPSAINVDALEKALADLSLGKPAAKPVAPGEKKKGSTPQPAAVQVAGHPFARVDLRVGRILKVERHPNADRLYVETVDLGEPEPRTVVSGLVEHVPIEELADRMCVFVCNLKPATLCKTLSSAMLLVAKDADGQLEPLIVPEGAKPGDRVSIEGVTPQPDAVIKPKEDTWEKVRVDLVMKEGAAHYTDKPLLVAGNGRLTSSKVPTGSIS